jgi:YbbR domain-containing protein
MRRAAREALVGNLAYKLFAILLALVTWAWVQSEQVVEEPVRVRLAWTYPDGLVPVTPPDEHVTVTLQGVQAWVRAARRQDLVVDVDLRSAREGAAKVDLVDRPVRGLPSQVRVAGLTPARIDLELDRLLRRTVPVVPSTRGELAAGYRLSGVRVEPDRVELVGPARVLRGLAEVSTDPVDLSGLRESATFEVGLELGMGGVRPARARRLAVHADVAVMMAERTLTDVPVRVDARWSASPAALDLSLRGPAAVLDALDAGAVHVELEVPVGWQGPGTARFGAADGPALRLSAPEGILLVTTGGEAVTLEAAR